VLDFSDVTFMDSCGVHVLLGDEPASSVPAVTGSLE